jgi:hypothetical protein
VLFGLAEFEDALHAVYCGRSVPLGQCQVQGVVGAVRVA